MQDPQTPAKILFLDIETAPSLGWVWGKWQQNVIDFKKDWYILSYAYKWAHENEIKVIGLIDLPGYKRHAENDKALAKTLWKLLDEADIVIAQNGDGFDVPKINTRFLIHDLQPPSPYKTVDTLKIARKVFAFDSNKLDDLGHYLNIGRKLPHTGFHLWKGCMTGDPEAWKLMKEYNAHDIDLLEKLYYKVRAWDKNHPQVNKGQIANEACPKCSSDHVQKRGFSYTQLRKKQRYQCLNCTTWYEGSAKKV
jgi:uncharacterized protein YprB with RNaseH-like and TPR domain